MTKTKAPDIPTLDKPNGGYPSGGARLGPAWVEMWKALSKDPEAFHDAYPIAERVAAKYDLAPSTLIGLIKRAATAGLLDREAKLVNTGKRGNRARTHYRIHADEIGQ